MDLVAGVVRSRIFQVLANSRQPACSGFPAAAIKLHDTLRHRRPLCRGPALGICTPVSPSLNSGEPLHRTPMITVPAIQVPGTNAKHSFHLLHGVRERL